MSNNQRRSSHGTPPSVAVPKPSSRAQQVTPPFVVGHQPSSRAQQGTPPFVVGHQPSSRAQQQGTPPFNMPPPAIPQHAVLRPFQDIQRMASASGRLERNASPCDSEMADQNPRPQTSAHSRAVPKGEEKTPRRPLVDDGLLDHIQTILGSDTALPPCTPSQLNLMLQALTLRSQQQLVEVTREDARLRESQENQRLDLQARAVALAGRTCEAQENLAAAQTAMVDRLEGLVSAQQDAANAADSLAKATSDLHQTLTALLFATHPELFTQ